MNFNSLSLSTCRTSIRSTSQFLVLKLIHSPVCLSHSLFVNLLIGRIFVKSYLRSISLHRLQLFLHLFYRLQLQRAYWQLVPKRYSFQRCLEVVVQKQIGLQRHLSIHRFCRLHIHELQCWLELSLSSRKVLFVDRLYSSSRQIFVPCQDFVIQRG